MKEERLYIVGYMASGKTTFGYALAEHAGWDFLDLDEEIVRREQMPIPDIIALKGEEYFRRVESMILRSTSSLKRTVIACGGGTPCYRDNMEFMTLHGMTLWLVVSPRRMVSRMLEAGVESRPLLSGKNEDELLDYVTCHLRQRQPYYFKAQWRFSGEHLENKAEIKASVDKFINDLNLLK